MFAAGVGGADAADAAQKRVRALQKKLRQIQQLKDKRDNEGGEWGQQRACLSYSMQSFSCSLHVCSWCCCRTVVQIVVKISPEAIGCVHQTAGARWQVLSLLQVPTACAFLCRCVAGVKLEPEQIQKIEAEASVIAEIRELGGTP
jgi:hypothetical protein